jgi:hypothetical protein
MRARLRNLTYLISLFILVSLLSGFTTAQVPTLENEAMNTSSFDFVNENIEPPSVTADTVKKADTTVSSNLNDLANISLAFKPKLLPDNISFMEKFLWDDNGFMRKIGIAGPLNAESRQKELQARRTMLSIHQITGLATLGLMITADYYGQQVLNGKYNLSGTHKTFVLFTLGMYSITALLAVLSPPPMIRRSDEISTVTIHKYLAWLHFAGMILTPIIGKMIVKHRALNINTAHFHQISAYITTAIFAASVIVLTF